MAPARGRARRSRNSGRSRLAPWIRDRHTGRHGHIAPVGMGVKHELVATLEEDREVRQPVAHADTRIDTEVTRLKWWVPRRRLWHTQRRHEIAAKEVVPWASEEIRGQRRLSERVLHVQVPADHLRVRGLAMPLRKFAEHPVEPEARPCEWRARRDP